MTEIVTLTPDTAGVAPTPAISEEAITSIPHTPSVSEPAAIVETPTETKTESVPEVKRESTLLGTPLQGPKEEAKEPVQGTETESKEQQSNQSEEPAPLPTYDKFTAAEDFPLDDGLVGDFSKSLGEFERLTKADHAEVQKFGQSLIERHVTEVKRSIEQHTNSILEAFEQQKKDWRETFEKDPEIGGNRRDTTINAALEFIRTHGGNEEQRKEIHELMENTGIGNHPAMIRLLAQAARSTAFTEGKPLPATNPVPTIKNKIEKRYGVL